MYSYSCIKVKIKPKEHVSISAKIDSFFLFATKEWCDQVIVQPELNRIAVFTRGNPHGLIATIPRGGHVTPISTPGDNEEWKNAQKKLTNNIASEKINIWKPNLNADITLLVWAPWNVASLTTSFNQKTMISAHKSNPKNNKCTIPWWKKITKPNAVVNTDAAKYIGHGEGETRW